MLSRTHALPFTAVTDDRINVEFLGDADGRVVPFLDRLLRLLYRLEGRLPTSSPAHRASTATRCGPVMEAVRRLAR